MKEWVDLLLHADAFDPLTRDWEVLEHQYDLNRRAWSDYVRLRDRPGCLEREFSRIDLPVVVIHGACDPHPVEGVRLFLESTLKTVSFHIIPECGHYPWIERRDRTASFDIIRRELRAKSISTNGRIG